MPFMKNGKRDYAAELSWEHKSKPNRVKDRAERNAARAKMKAKGKVRKGDGKQVDHINAILFGGSNSPSNLRVVSAKTNLEKEAKRKQNASRKKQK